MYLDKRGLIGLKMCDIGILFRKFRDHSVKIGNDKILRALSGKRRVHTVGGRHNDDR